VSLPGLKDRPDQSHSLQGATHIRVRTRGPLACAWDAAGFWGHTPDGHRPSTLLAINAERDSLGHGREP